MFARKDHQTLTDAPSGSTALKTGEAGKGRPTPSRKEAQAAARERARLSTGKASSGKGARDGRALDARRMREAMKNGDERYLPARDKGQVRRAVRDYVDGRLCVLEFLIPLLLLIMALSYSGSPALRNLGLTIQTMTLLLAVIDTAWLIWRMRRRLSERFPGESLKGTSMYAVTRGVQLRFMRMPKPKVRLGGKPK